MSFAEIAYKIWNRWWITLIPAIILFTVFFPLVYQTKYTAVIQFVVDAKSVSLPSKQSDIAMSEIELRSDYNSIVASLSRFFYKQYRSINIQTLIAEKIGFPQDKINSKTPFYTVEDQTLGYVELTFESTNKDSVEKFLQVSEDVFFEIINDWNNFKQEDFKIKSNQDIESKILTKSTPVQSLLLPAILGFLGGLFVVIIWPLRDKNAISEINN